MSNRAYEEGYEEVVCPDGRRGLWMKVDKPLDPTWLSLCAGREGDDSKVHFKVGKVVTKLDILALEDCLRRVIWSVEMSSEKKDWDLHNLLLEGVISVLKRHNHFSNEDLSKCTDEEYLLSEELSEIIMNRLPKEKQDVSSD